MITSAIMCDQCVSSHYGPKRPLNFGWLSCTASFFAKRVIAGACSFPQIFFYSIDSTASARSHRIQLTFIKPLKTSWYGASKVTGSESNASLLKIATKFRVKMLAWRLEIGPDLPMNCLVLSSAPGTVPITSSLLPTSLPD